MEYRRLGAGGLTVSALTYGNWLAQSSNADEITRTCVAEALREGITTFDTADVYGSPDFGSGEKALGAALSGVRRESVEILTKVCLPTGPGRNDRGLSRKHVMESCHASLRRLGTEYIDVYQAHRYDQGTPLEETMAAFADLVRQGKVLYLGVSEWRPDQIEAAATLATEFKVPLVSNQPQYSLLWRVIESGVLPVCTRQGLGQIAFSPMAQGVLTGKYLPGRQPPAQSRGTDARGSRFVGRYLGDPVLSAVQRLRPIADELGLSLPQLALAWVLQNPGVSTAVIGASNPAQLRENTAAVNRTLSPEVLARIDAAFIDDTHGDLVERDPGKVAKPFDVMPAWKA